MKKIIIFFIFCSLAFSQSKEFVSKNANQLRLANSSVHQFTDSLIVSRKSPMLAFLYSLAVPGMGQLYAHRLDVGKYFMISEAALWLGFAAFTVYGNWMFNDAVSYAVNHAGIDKNNKTDDFYSNIGNY